ncbi:DUF2167 domain-containing protein [Paenibacillus albiflavus]|uniref:DUF2167 domain-containing protein n=1 Tax=Paenibacillus albiflavus TaxID=2545760 RepID=A0A4V2WP32_9BACL|nr:DUF2167 domain-containing protein [Paenibacillus albiflavus]TCZ77772.1 DUF2167 domain-containing protein [Paenibacillus albiflavus]
MKRFWNKCVHMICLSALITMICVPQSFAEENLNWIFGENQKVSVGNDLAELKLSPDFAFLDAANTKKFELSNGNKPTGNEIGLVVSTDETQYWVLFFEYIESGHIKDDEKADIDAKALLQSYIDGTKEMNKDTAPENQLFVDGWDVAPFYDNARHSLSWSLLGHNYQNEKIINYNTRILTREGYISAILVSDPEHLAADRKMVTEQVLPNLSIKQGKSYADFNEKTDKLAEYGLTGLILGGAGLAIAKKAGLIALLIVAVKKFWFIIIAAIVALFGLIRKKFGKREEQPAEVESPAQVENPSQVDPPASEK